MQRTPLTGRHAALGARLVDFAGWEMPVQYPGGILAEHAATRTACGLFDTCHMGEFRIEAPDVRAALNRIFTGDFRALAPGRLRYTFLAAEDGGTIDDAVVMLFSDRLAWVVVNAGDIPGDFAAVRERLPAGADAADLSAGTGKLDVQGPRAADILARATGIDLRRLPFYSFVETRWRNETLLFSRSGYTGEPGAELYVAADAVGALWEALLEEGRADGLLPCGLGARDTLRLEAGLPLHGHELSGEIDPVRAGFGRFVSLDKPEAFPGKAALAARQREFEAGAGMRIAGLRLEDKRTPRAGFDILRGGERIGRITSGATGPTVGAPLAFGWLRADCAEAGTQLEVEIRGKPAAARVVETPFYANSALRARGGPPAA